MPKQLKPRKVGRPILPKGEAKGKIVPVRFDPHDLKIVAAAAKANNQTVSEWIRHVGRTAAESLMFKSTLHDAMQTILLQQPDRTASTSLLAEEIAKSGLYERKDGDAARAQQINARARHYPEIFEFSEPGIIRLK